MTLELLVFFGTSRECSIVINWSWLRFSKPKYFSQKRNFDFLISGIQFLSLECICVTLLLIIWKRTKDFSKVYCCGISTIEF